MEEERNEDVVERLAREFLKGMEEEEKKEEKKEDVYGSTYEEPTEEKPFEEPIIEEEIKPERPSQEKIEEILTKLEEEEREIGLPKEPPKVEEEEEEEEFAEIEETPEEEILVKKPKKRKRPLKFAKFAIFGCLLGGIGAASFYFGRAYYKSIIDFVNLNVVNKIFKPSCELRISSNPEGGDLFIDDMVKGKTPITIKKLAFGDHNIRIEKEGFKPYISVISVTSRKPIEIFPTLEPEIKITEEIIPSGTATLIVRTNPKNALVYIDGQRAKMPYILLSGSHSVRVENEGFFTFSKIIEIKPQEIKEVFAQLTPCLGSIFIDSNPRGGDVSLNGDLRGKTPAIIKSISPWKPFRIRIKKKGYFDWNGITFVEPNQRTKIMAFLKSEESEAKSQKIEGERISYETKKEIEFVPSQPSKKEELSEIPPSILELKRSIDTFKERIKVEAPIVPPFIEEPYLKKEFPQKIVKVPEPQITQGEGYCFITSVPAGAEIFLDGRLIGKTPLRKYVISAGKHRLKACLAGFKESEKEIIVSGETSNFFNFFLSK